MLGLANVNTPEKTVKAYAEISTRQTEALIKIVSSISTQSIRDGESAGDDMINNCRC